MDNSSDTKFFLNNLWRWKCGLPEEDYNSGKKKQLPTYEELRESEWSQEFIELMRNRMVMGAYRYGTIRAKNKPNYDRLQSIEKRLNLYKETGNDELLVDIANMCLIEFEIGTHPNKHFDAVDDGEHMNIKK